MSITKKYFLGVIVVLIIIAFVVLKINTNQSKKESGELKNINQNSELLEPTASIYTTPTAPNLVNDDWVIGNREANLKIFVYEDYASSFSADLAKTLNRLRDDFAGRVAIIVRPYSGNSKKASDNMLLMICAAQQGKWLEMRELLLTLASDELLNNLENNNLEKIELDRVKLADCLTNLNKSGKIEQLSQSTQAQGVQGAPTIFIGSEMIIGARPYEDFFDSNGDKIEGLKTVVERALQ